MTWVVVFEDQDGNIPEVFGAFDTESDAAQWAVETFPDPDADDGTEAYVVPLVSLGEYELAIEASSESWTERYQ